MKSRVAADGPEMRRIYELAADLKVPVLIHFQEVSQQLSPGTYNTGFDRLPAILKEYRNTTFIGHADAFWANISTEVPADIAYPTGPVKRGGLTDRMLEEYPNLYADLAATSARNALARSRFFRGLPRAPSEQVDVRERLRLSGWAWGGPNQSQSIGRRKVYRARDAYCLEATDLA